MKLCGSVCGYAIRLGSCLQQLEAKDSKGKEEKRREEGRLRVGVGSDAKHRPNVVKAAAATFC